MHRTRVRVAEDALDANETIARANRDDFDRAGVRVVNLMSAPGSGKTTLLERTLADLGGARVAVLEGDVMGSADADRLSALHIPVVQLNTDSGFGGECHLDANMVRSALPALPLAEIDLLVIENVGNLVCPAEFRVGEDVRAMVASVAEGEDKPLKYPLMFRTTDLVVVNKIDLLPHLDFDLERFKYNLDAVNPGVETLLTSARTGDGVDRLRGWLAGSRRRRGQCIRRPQRSGGRRVTNTLATQPLRARIDAALAARTELNREFFAGEAERVARCCHAMAERFGRGGRLLAIGAGGSTGSDAAHIAVEFVHPVIVGKRALPALVVPDEAASP